MAAKKSSKKTIVSTNYNLSAAEWWKSYDNNHKPNCAYEYTLYTDIRIIGDIEGECGPYLFLNTCAMRENKLRTISEPFILPAITLRCYRYNPGAILSEHPLKTDYSLYHGGDIPDEIAALASLFLAARIKISNVTREFINTEKEPLGRPRAFNYELPPTINFRGIIPSAIGTRELAVLGDLKKILILEKKEYIAFVRAATLYQDALWIGESEPHLAWVMLVSALESVANCWSKNINISDALKDSLPRLAQYIESEGLSCHLEYFAKILIDITGSTKKFKNFCLKFLPPAPEERPKNSYSKIDWENQESWQEILKVVYDYRSKALHRGIPFPAPMCLPPSPEATAETCPASRVGNGSWEQKHVPINLNVFAYVTRGILLKWLYGIYEERSIKEK